MAPSSGTIEPILLTLGLTMTSTVPPGRSRFTSIPGTSCLATISLSLRDKSHSVPNFAPFQLRVETLSFVHKSENGEYWKSIAYHHSEQLLLAVGDGRRVGHWLRNGGRAKQKDLPEGSGRSKRWGRPRSLPLAANHCDANNARDSDDSGGSRDDNKWVDADSNSRWSSNRWNSLVGRKWSLVLETP